MLDFETSNSKSEVSKTNLWKITSSSKNYGTSEGAVSHHVLYHQPLPDTRHEDEFVRFQIGIKDFWLEVFHYFSEKYLFLKNYVTSEGVVSHNVLYYQQLSNARYQVSRQVKFGLSNYQMCTFPLNNVFKVSKHPSFCCPCWQREYWRTVEGGQNHVAIQRANIDTAISGR